MIPTPTLTRSQADAWRPTLPTVDDWDLLAWYRAMVPTLPDPAICVEVGIAYGRSLLFLASELVRLGQLRTTIYGVDPWGRPPPASGGGGTVSSAEYALERLVGQADVGELGLIRLVGLPSVQAARAMTPASCHLVMLDGDHTYAGVGSDVRAWLTMIAPGGVLAGHDWGDEYPGVGQAVAELLGRRVHRWERMWWVEYPG